jgi:hypothetical protein
VKFPTTTRKEITMKRVSRRWTIGAVLAVLLSATAYKTLIPNGTRPPGQGQAKSEEARQQAAQFIEYYRSITLTAEQEKVKNEALTAIPAPCCKGYSIATCCCPCNLAKAAWGLSHFLIADKGYGVQRVREEVQRWIGSTNHGGYAGNACYIEHCNQPFEKDGCGGMDERQVL